jgi:hypothetical protein
MPATKRKHVLASLREYLGATQGQFAIWCGCSAFTIQSIEVGRLVLSKKLAERISLVTGVSAEWLLKNKLDSPMPSLVRPKGEGSTVANPRNARRWLWKPMNVALRITESIEVDALPLFYHYTKEYYFNLLRVYQQGQSFETEPEEERLSYIKDQIEAFLHPSEEEIEKEKELDAYLWEQHGIRPVVEFTGHSAAAQKILREEEERKRAEAQLSPSSGDVPKPAEKKPRQPRRATRRTRESA